MMTENKHINNIAIEKKRKADHADNQPGLNDNKKYVIIAITVSIVVIALIVFASYFLLTSDPGVTEKIRDVFIIFMAFVSLVIGIALVILIVQLSLLINLLQNEIRPIINSTSETVNTVKGTTQFLSQNLTEPVIKVNQALAVIRKIFAPHKK